MRRHGSPEAGSQPERGLARARGDTDGAGGLLSSGAPDDRTKKTTAPPRRGRCRVRVPQGPQTARRRVRGARRELAGDADGQATLVGGARRELAGDADGARHARAAEPAVAAGIPRRGLWGTGSSYRRSWASRAPAPRPCPPGLRNHRRGWTFDWQAPTRRRRRPVSGTRIVRASWGGREQGCAWGFR
jgi:hypothetical protein